MPSLLHRCPHLFDSDGEYPDMECGKLVAKRYLRLTDSTDYRSKTFMDEDETCESRAIADEDLPLPHNLLLEGRRLTPALRRKIWGALAICSSPTIPTRVYQLFHLMKFLGYRYNYKFNIWRIG